MDVQTLKCGRSPVKLNQKNIHYCDPKLDDQAKMMSVFCLLNGHEHFVGSTFLRKTNRFHLRRIACAANFSYHLNHINQSASSGDIHTIKKTVPFFASSSVFGDCNRITFGHKKCQFWKLLHLKKSESNSNRLFMNTTCLFREWIEHVRGRVQQIRLSSLRKNMDNMEGESGWHPSMANIKPNININSWLWIPNWLLGTFPSGKINAFHA